MTRSKLGSSPVLRGGQIAEIVNSSALKVRCQQILPIHDEARASSPSLPHVGPRRRPGQQRAALPVRTLTCRARLCAKWMCKLYTVKFALSTWRFVEREKVARLVGLLALWKGMLTLLRKPVSATAASQCAVKSFIVKAISLRRS